MMVLYKKKLTELAAAAAPPTAAKVCSVKLFPALGTSLGVVLGLVLSLGTYVGIVLGVTVGVEVGLVLGYILGFIVALSETTTNSIPVMSVDTERCTSLINSLVEDCTLFLTIDFIAANVISLDFSRYNLRFISTLSSSARCRV